jgi:glycosyltransferase involved in cell wall biosynthesis
MRILLVSHVADNPHSGSSRVYHLLTNGLRERGQTVRCLHLGDLQLPRGFEFPARRLLLPQYASKAASAYLGEGFDVIMASSGMLYPLFRRLQRTARHPLLVHHLHGLSLFDRMAIVTETLRGHMSTSLAYKTVTGRLPVFWDEQGARHCDITIVQNGRDADAVEEVSRKPVKIIPLSLHPAIAEAAHGAPAMEMRDPSSLLWFGSWVERKGAFYLPRAFRKIVERFPEAHLTIGGSGMDRGDVIGGFDESLRARITVLPRITIEEHIAELARNSVFLFPSLSEGFGFALLEAMAMKMACVATNTGLGGDWLCDRDNAMIVPAASSLHLADAACALLDDGALRARLARNARAVAEKFTVERMLDSYLGVFEEYRK